MDAMSTYQDLGYDKIFVSLDGTEEQDKVLDRGIIVAANNNAELTIGHVIDSTALETAGTYPVDLIPGLEKAFRDSVADGVKKAEEEPQIKSVKVLVKTGRIRETLKEEMLDVVKPDLVICGARGLSSIKYALLGSISTYLLRNSPCDILVVK
jgi:nucleotide-binding universal stress UspA family protein